MKRATYPTAEPTQMDLMRLASFIDGEGSILLTERKYKGPWLPGMYVRVVIANTDPRLPIWCRKVFGGVFVTGDRRRAENHRIAYKWHVSCRQAVAILEKCLPYFLLKREQAEIAIAFQATIQNGRGRGVSLPEGVREQRLEMKDTLHRLRWQSLPVLDGELDVAKSTPKGASEVIN